MNVTTNKVLISLVALLIAICSAGGKPKPHYTFLLPDGYVGWIQVGFADRNAPHLPIDNNGGRRIQVPDSEVPRTCDIHVHDGRRATSFITSRRPKRAK
jgi:hypothetical protein